VAAAKERWWKRLRRRLLELGEKRARKNNRLNLAFELGDDGALL